MPGEEFRVRHAGCLVDFRRSHGFAASMPKAFVLPRVNGMTLRRFAALAALFSFGFSASDASAEERFTTDNFIVSAPTAPLAKTFGEYAEFYRREKAIDWLGAELPKWPNKCPLKVQIRLDKTGGETTFTFGLSPGTRPRVMSQDMLIFGETAQLLKSVLPHEVTHTVFAHHFGEAVPRWADEGGSVLSENDEERYLHDVRCRELLVKGQGIPLKALFSMTQYPSDQHTLYAQGYSVVNYLIGKDGGRKKFLEFVRVGLKTRDNVKNNNWQQAAELYGYDSVDDLQDDWIQTLKASRPSKGNATLTAAPKAEPGKAPVIGTLASASPKGTETRTSPGGLPLQLEAPIVARGVAPAPKFPAPPSTAPALPIPPPLKLGPPELPRGS